MQRLDAVTLFSATDLANFLECEHLASLDLAALAREDLRARRSERDESAELYARKGDAHERAYLELLRARGLDVVDVALEGGTLDQKVSRTRAALEAGASVIYQAALRDGALAGHADFLRRVDGQPSSLGNYCYGVVDTKLARSTKGKFIVQLAFYGHLLERVQGVEPARMHVVLGDMSERSYRCADYSRYFRSLLDRFLGAMETLAAGQPSPAYPLPCGHCDPCHWREHCEARRIDDDHLCQVAGMARTQAMRLEAAGIRTMAALAALPQRQPVPRMQVETLERLRLQASLQDRARRTGEHACVVLPPDPEAARGFHRLPPPDAADLYFDMEGDPLEDGGLEYLFGIGWGREGGWTFRPFWAHSRTEERAAFEQFVDFVVAHRRQHPGAHVYHYASYEETALKRLASLHATREVEVDSLLRQGALVDLYKVAREGVRISADSYSIKAVERFYRPAREGEVKNAGASIVWYERWRETHEAQLLQDIEAYNRDDVESTRQLHDWLLRLRPHGLPWKVVQVVQPAAQDDAELTKAQKAERRLVPYRQHLVDALPADPRQ